jgi:mRNA interferase MazF
MMFQKGNLVLVPFPFSDLSTSKVRPAVVVSSSLYQTHEPDIILAAITTNISAATGSLDYVLRDWQLAGLKYPSALKPVLFTLDPGRVIHTVGTLTDFDLNEIDNRLRLILGL